MKIVVIIPVYNERDTIGVLIDALEREFEKISNHRLVILIVDGNSPDGTGSAVKEKMAIYNNLYLITEKEKRGLGMAYIEGMKYAMRELRADAIMEFDGDFQHDPGDIPRLIEELDRGYDYVIGSRYVKGGEIPKEWAAYKKFLSRFGSLFIRAALGLSTYDNTSGFKLSRVKGFAENLPLDENKILSRRHAYKIHLLYEMIKMGARVKEVPIKFLEREGDASKSTSEDIKESLKVVVILWLRRFKKLR